MFNLLRQFWLAMTTPMQEEIPPPHQSCQREAERMAIQDSYIWRMTRQQ